MSVDTGLLACPRCRGDLRASHEHVLCPSCDIRYPVIDGIPNLLLDRTADTQLDVEKYDAEHKLNSEKSKRVYYNIWNGMLREHGDSFKTVLEIGSGSGNFTYGLIQFSPYESVCCSDISFRFLDKLRTWMPKSSKDVSYYIFDANHCPFKDGSFDAVLGHSVLHHILDYRQLLERAYSLLKDGGLVGFTEPVLDAFAINGFIASMILEFDARTKLARFEKKEIALLTNMARKAANISRAMTEDLESLSAVEDKHLFGIEELQCLARDIGFRKVIYSNTYHPIDVGKVYKDDIKNSLGRFDFDVRKIDRFDFVFDSLTASCGAALGKHMPLHFGLFLFKK